MRTTKIKVCGVRSKEMALYCVGLGVEFIGLMFYEKSSRHVDLKTAKEIALAVKNAGGIPVAVFAEADAQTIIRVCLSTQISYAQLHGDNPRHALPALPDTLNKIYVRCVDGDKILPSPEQDLKSLRLLQDFLLFDGPRGGSGKSINWDAVKNEHHLRFFLAGGLNSNNVAQAIQQCCPFAVDVSSGVESSEGEKSKLLIAQFVAAVNEVNDV